LPNLSVEVVDPVAGYVSLMKTIFDFSTIKSFLETNKDFKILFDGMSGGRYILRIGMSTMLKYVIVTGPYAHRIFVQELGLTEASLLNCVPSETFNRGLCFF